MDRGRHSDLREVARRCPAAVAALEQSLVDQHREHLLDEEGIALCSLGDPLTRRLIELRSTEKVVDQTLRLGAGERLEKDCGRVQLAASPGGPRIQELRPCEADEEDGRVARPVGNMLDEVEKRRLAPVDVVEDDDERPLAGEGLKKPTDSPEGFLAAGGRLGDAHQLRDALHDDPRAFVSCYESGETRFCLLGFLLVSQCDGLLHRLDDGPECDPGAVRKAASPQH
jgi:hypothetical protein